MSIFVEGLEEIRASQRLDHHIPPNYANLGELDARCQELVDQGRLIVVDSPEIRKAMLAMKFQQMPRSEFRELGNSVYSSLIDRAVAVGNLRATQYADGTWDKQNCKAGISIRAGLAFMQSVQQHPLLKDIEIGFLTQTRNEEDPDDISNVPEKLGRFDELIAMLTDPMLAKGGSMHEFIKRVKGLGATSVITVTAFSAPQGIVKIADNTDAIMVTTPLEAGLNEHAYIIGGLELTEKLGDSGDRSFGNVEQ